MLGFKTKWCITEEHICEIKYAVQHRNRTSKMFHPTTHTTDFLLYYNPAFVLHQRSYERSPTATHLPTTATIDSTPPPCLRKAGTTTGLTCRNVRNSSLALPYRLLVFPHHRLWCVKRCGLFVDLTRLLRLLRATATTNGMRRETHKIERPPGMQAFNRSS